MGFRCNSNSNRGATRAFVGNDVAMGMLEMLFNNEMFCSKIFWELGWDKHYCRSAMSVEAGTDGEVIVS